MMQRLEVVYRPTAVLDLDMTYWSVMRQTRNRTVANQYIARVRAQCSAIGLAPNIGRPRDDLRAGLRTIAFERQAVIAYLVRDDKVEITNIWFGGRNMDAINRS